MDTDAPIHQGGGELNLDVLLQDGCFTHQEVLIFREEHERTTAVPPLPPHRAGVFDVQNTSRSALMGLQLHIFSHWWKQR